MIAERPGGVTPSEPGRGTPDTKAQREEKQKVEKVREIDPDEEAQRRKRKFQMMMGDEDQLTDGTPGNRAPSPFETQFYTTGTAPVSKKTSSDQVVPGSVYSSTGPNSPTGEDLDVNDIVVPSPAYSPSPNVNAAPQPTDVDAQQETALPQSDRFWENTDLPPDQPLPDPKLFETQRSSAKTTGEQPPTQPPGKAIKGAHPDAKKGDMKEGNFDPFQPPVPAKQGKGKEAKFEPFQASVPAKPAKTEASPFGVPGKAPKESAMKGKKEESPPPFFTPPKSEKEKASLKVPKKSDDEMTLPYAGKTETTHPAAKGEKKPDKEEAPTARYLTREEEQAPHETRIVPHKAKKETTPPPLRSETTRKGQEKKELPDRLYEKEGEQGEIIFKRREKDRERDEREKEKERSLPQIQSPSLSALPAHIVPIAQAAVQQAEPYLSPQTAQLFFQMVGTIYYMASPQGVTRTEIVLNNPQYANSKFYGARITIEKYATAPDSFNIRLSGSDQAVVTFKENIPDLMNAFQNGNYAFRIGRIDAEYTSERPVFRRKDRDEDKGSMGGDLGERRK